jgi:4-hydroxy-tetrahydrodipicolinate synthase
MKSKRNVFVLLWNELQVAFLSLQRAGSNNTMEAVELTRFAKEVGCDGALLITPYYNKPTQAGLLAHYKKIANEVDIPIILYNVPSRTGIKLEAETVAELNKIPNIVAIKEAGGSVDQVSQILSLCDITVLSGDDSLTLPMMSVGAVVLFRLLRMSFPQNLPRCAH